MAFTVRYACPRCGMEWPDTDSYRAHIDGQGTLCPPLASDAVPDLLSVVVVWRAASACNLLPPPPAARPLDGGGATWRRHGGMAVALNDGGV